MNLPEITPQNIAQLLNKETIINETIAQIQKDFGMYNINIQFDGNTDTAYEQLMDGLTLEVKQLLANDTSKDLNVMQAEIHTNKETVFKLKEDADVFVNALQSELNYISAKTSMPNSPPNTITSSPSWQLISVTSIMVISIQMLPIMGAFLPFTIM